jgi:hypothetical protein
MQIIRKVRVGDSGEARPYQCYDDVTMDPRLEMLHLHPLLALRAAMAHRKTTSLSEFCIIVARWNGYLSIKHDGNIEFRSLSWSRATNTCRGINATKVRFGILCTLPYSPPSSIIFQVTGIRSARRSTRT